MRPSQKQITTEQLAFAQAHALVLNYGMPAH